MKTNYDEKNIITAEKFRHQRRKYYLGSWYVIRKIPAPKIPAQKNPTPKCRKKVPFAKVSDIRQLTVGKKNTGRRYIYIPVYEEIADKKYILVAYVGVLRQCRRNWNI